MSCADTRTPAFLFSSAIIFFCFAGEVNSQNYNITPNDSQSAEVALDELVTLSIQLQNNSSDTLNIAWAEIAQQISPEWNAQVCDNNVCFDSLVNSSLMLPVIPGEYGLILLHVTPHIEFDTAVVRYKVWEIQNPTMSDTLTFIIACNAYSGLDETHRSFSLTQSMDSETLILLPDTDEPFQVILTSMNGAVLLNEDFQGQTSFDLSNYSPGIYLLHTRSLTRNIVLSHLILVN